MNHYRSLPDFPFYDRTRDPHMKPFYLKQAKMGEVITVLQWTNAVALPSP